MYNQKQNKHVELAKDCGWSWIVLIASFFIYTIYFGMVVPFGVYFVEFRDHFKCTRKEAAMVGSILYGGICLTGPLSNLSYRRFGSRLTVMASGIIGTIGYVLTYFSRSIFSVAIAQGITAVGYGLGLAALIAVQTEYFDRYKNFATAFIHIGSPAGTFAFALAFVYFVNSYTVLGSMLINACFSAQIVVFGAFLRSRIRLEYLPLRKLFDFSLLRDPLQLLACLQMALFGGCSYIFYLMSNELMMQSGLSLDESAQVLTVVGVVAACGRIAATIYAHYFSHMGRSVLYVLANLCWTAGLFLSLLHFASSMTIFIIVGIIFGLGHGVMVPLNPSILIDFFGAQKLSSSVSFTIFSCGVGGLIIPWSCGYLADAYGTVEVAFVLAGCGGLLAVLTCLIMFGWFYCRKNSLQLNN